MDHLTHMGYMLEDRIAERASEGIIGEGQPACITLNKGTVYIAASGISDWTCPGIYPILNRIVKNQGGEMPIPTTDIEPGWGELELLIILRLNGSYQGTKIGKVAQVQPQEVFCRLRIRIESGLTGWLFLRHRRMTR
jgi:hypothetical protein